MKVLHLSTATSWRGGEQQITYLVEELARLGLEQTVCCPEGSPLQTVCTGLPVSVVTFRHRGLMDLGLAKLVATTCRSSVFSLVHAHDSHAHSAAVIAATLFGNKLPIVLSRRVDFPVSSNPLSRWKYNHSSIRKILCVSKKIEDVMRRDIAQPSKLAVVYDGIDPEKFKDADRSLLRREFGLQAGTRIVGNASALADHKDYFTFTDVAERLSATDNNIRFVIIGDGPERENIRQYIFSKKLDNIVLMLGFRKDVHRLISCFDVFLMTSSTEGLGSVLLDAFAAGVPVVATSAGGIPEIVKHQETGLLASVKDAALLADHVHSILSDPTLATRLAENARSFVGGFTKEKMAKATMGYYEQVMG